MTTTDSPAEATTVVPDFGDDDDDFVIAETETDERNR